MNCGGSFLIGGVTTLPGGIGPVGVPYGPVAFLVGGFCIGGVAGFIVRGMVVTPSPLDGTDAVASRARRTQPSLMAAQNDVTQPHATLTTRDLAVGDSTPQ